MKDFQKNGLIMVVLTTLASGINYLCQIGLGRVMSIASFGVMNSLFSLILVLSVPGTSVNMLAARQVAQRSGSVDACAATAYRLRLASFYIGCGLMCTILLVCVPLGKMLEAHPVMILLTGFAVVLSFFPSVISGILTGREAFLTAGLFSLIVPIIKALGIGTAMLFPSEAVQQFAVMSAIILGNLIAIIAGKRILFPNGNKKPKDMASAHTEIPITMIAVNFLYLLFSNGDIFLVTACFGSEQAGIYSASMLFGRVLFFFTTAVVSVLLPYVSKANGNGQDFAQVFCNALLVTLLVSAIGFVPINLFPDFFIQLLYGENYLPAVPYVPYSCVVAIFASLLNLELNCFIGLGKERRMLIHLAAALVILLLAVFLFHQSIPTLLVILAAILGALVLIELPVCWRGRIDPF